MRKFYLLVDTETAIDGSIMDIAAVVLTRESEKDGGDSKKLKVVNQLAVLLGENWGRVELFHDKSSTSPFSKLRLEQRNEAYQEMLQDGRRVLASVGAVNRWLAQVITTYPEIELTAYNLAFDVDKMRKQGIFEELFKNRFCLWHASIGNICDSKKYRQFALDNHLFGNRTKTGHMGISTSAESVSHFISGNDLIEPHTALEDCLLHEKPVLEAVINRKDWRKKIVSYNWRKCVLNHYFEAKC